MAINRTRARFAAIAAAGALVVGGLGLTIPAASAAGIVGTATTSIQAGTSTQAFSVLTASTCPSGDRVITTIHGTGFPADGYNIGGNMPTSSVRYGAGYKIDVLETFADMAASNAMTLASGNAFTITVSCVTGLSSTSLGDFNTNIAFYTATQWANTDAVFSTATVNPATGTKDSTVGLATAKACPAGDKVQVSIAGSGFPAGGYNMTGKDSTSTKVSGAGYNLPLLETLSSAASAQTPPATLSGKYTFTVGCYYGLNATRLSSATAAVYFVDSANYQSVPVATTATLAVTGLSGTQVAPGRPVTLTVSLSTPGGVPAGVVEFFDGATSLGSQSVTAGASGVTKTAQLIKSDFTQASHTVKATFTPGSADFSAVTTATSTFTVEVPTSATTLVASPSTSAQQYDLVSFTATVVPSDAVGRVTFKDGATTLGTGVVSAGTAAFTTSSLAVGDHSITAVFDPTDATAFTSSTSAAVAYTISVRPGPAPVAETVRTTITAQGALTISVAAGEDGLVNLGTPTLNGTADRLVASGAIDPITVTDSRTGGTDTGFAVSAQMTNFSSATGNSFPAAYVGITPAATTVSGELSVTAAAATAPESPLNGATKDLINGGLAGNGAPLATAPSGFRGTATISGNLSLEVPTSVTPDTYTATLTITAL